MQEEIPDIMKELLSDEEYVKYSRWKKHKKIKDWFWMDATPMIILVLCLTAICGVCFLLNCN